MNADYKADNTAESKSQSVTLRSILLGVAVVVFVAAVPSISSFYFKSFHLLRSLLPPALLIPVLLLIFGVNGVLRSVAPQKAFSRQELIFIFVMGLMAAGTMQIGIHGNFIGIISAPEYFATSENRWFDFYQLPMWLIPSDTDHAMRYFYSGLPPGRSIPWEAWLVPMFWWFSIVLALMFALTCIMVILRKQWYENEKLTFPLAEVPIRLVQYDHGRRLPDICYDKLFQIGVAIPLFLICWNTINYFAPGWPRIDFTQAESALPGIRNFPPIYVKPDWFIMGLAYLMPLDMLFSFWVFRLAATIFLALSNRFGFGMGTGYNEVWTTRDPISGWAGLGALVFIVIWGLWMARSHLRDVWKGAWLGRKYEGDHDEIFSYRTAVVGLAISWLYIVAWFVVSGMSIPVAVVFVLITLIMIVGITKIIAETGVVYIHGTVTSQAFVVHTFGSTLLTPPEVSSLVVSFALFRACQGFIMPAIAHSTKLGDVFKLNRRHLFLALALALIVTFISAVVTMIVLGYTDGAFNFGSHPFKFGHVEAYNNMIKKITDPASRHWGRIMSMVAGGGIAAGVMALRYRFPGFPLHPMGLTVASGFYINITAISLFLVWLVKMVLLRIGGVVLYERTKPLFLGFVVGHVLGLVVGAGVDWLWFPGDGHIIETGSRG